jgi:N-dimethylarginine dimethylaminohydrolase
LVNCGLAALSSFTHEEPKSEELYLRRWLEDAGFLLWQERYGISFEGEGDATFSPKGIVSGLLMDREPRF